ncbi:gamma-secretase subunit PEN-2-like protein [Dinothrombium tinctorium]|uniref:Gamma-secretase subunit PEN-2 n=1 Tax=Dinothrombium tinctorium TaxID=1965070 RepID=A0A3S3PW33_9ACAR|nr:gamma-secretase subunit PEN-2-like protein [Dinothrombium tinctorium]RWS17458.1 gamma-secretase subunit PEN-2-like protein [Dinothrombium tinctorium]
MDLRKLKDDDKLVLCRRYYYGGFALLPLLWIVNFVWFFNEAFRRKPPYAEQKQIQTYVWRSGVGALVWIVVLLAWNIYFQKNRPHVWWGDYLSFIIPTGIP